MPIFSGNSVLIYMAGLLGAKLVEMDSQGQVILKSFKSQPKTGFILKRFYETF